MKPSFVVQTTALLGSTCLVLLSTTPSAKAITFDQKELDQERVVAVAVPLAQGDRYNLLILEQLSNSRLCWQQNASNPSVVDPLLLQFDFTNICGRSTDSNGYSVRVAGQDKSLDYRLSIAKQGDRLVLLAVPARSGNGAPFEIGRTDTLSAGFLKLNLNPEWRFTKRTYQGKTLGHIYLTRDTLPTTTDRIAGRSSSVGGPWTSSNTASRSRPTPRYSTPFAGRSLNQPSAYSSRVMPITAPIEIPVPAPRVSLVRPLSAPTYNSVPTVAAGVLPVPTGTIPMGTAGNEPDLITASTPSLNLNAIAPGLSGSSGSVYQVAMVNPRYRVFVNPVDSAQQRMVKTLVPDAFRSSYRGRPVLQVGAFQDRIKADEVIDLLNRNGIVSILADQ
jgi:hypothetical protein